MNGQRPSEVAEVRAGIDWLTLTLPRQYETGMLWATRCATVIETIGKGGYEVKPRSMQGYYGISAGNCFIGERDDGYMCQLTGYHANDHFGAVFRPECNVPRIDVQVTVKYTKMPKHIARRAYDDATRANLLLAAPRRRKLYIIVGSDGGDTFYLGAPSSNQRGRLYNKEVQSENPEYSRCWRYEVVFRNELAHQCAAELASTPAARVHISKALVSGWYERRGVDCSAFSGSDKVALPIVRTLPTDIERQLLWLQKQVGPTMRALIEAGYGDTILERLGLSDVFSSRETET